MNSTRSPEAQRFAVLCCLLALTCIAGEARSAPLGPSRHQLLDYPAVLPPFDLDFFKDPPIALADGPARDPDAPRTSPWHFDPNCLRRRHQVVVISGQVPQQAAMLEIESDQLNLLNPQRMVVFASDRDFPSSTEPAAGLERHHQTDRSLDWNLRNRGAIPLGGHAYCLTGYHQAENAERSFHQDKQQLVSADVQIRSTQPVPDRHLADGGPLGAKIAVLPILWIVATGLIAIGAVGLGRSRTGWGRLLAVGLLLAGLALHVAVSRSLIFS
ncbi:hypothetical protein [Sphingomonas sp. S2-65]|uniref:hypothetical protein n=1 Tax=Sphingomonas sp. S2-65 TaxID=2903960 RepID=UPI001F4772E6|nr:hypothetical protein [Sphingomonas sp. S2-65]UYY57995.1 hypothetical protein LZ586_15225 [Sphingomonas sp. S2-65]